jgi:hypothetical protein
MRVAIQIEAISPGLPFVEIKLWREGAPVIRLREEIKVDDFESTFEALMKRAIEKLKLAHLAAMSAEQQEGARCLKKIG